MSDEGSLLGRQPPTTPVRKAPFLPGHDLTIRRMGTTQTVGLTIYVFRDVLEELIFSAQFHPAHTTVGILSGGYYAGAAGEYVEVRGFQDTAVIDDTQSFAQRLGREWADLWRDEALAETGLIPLGWFTSQPGCDAKPGPFEIITHLSYFNLPYQLFVMLDPLTRMLGVYRQVRDSTVENVAFNLIESASIGEEHRDDDRGATGA